MKDQTVWEKIDNIATQNRWAGDNIGNLIRALVKVGENPLYAQNIARNALEDAGINIKWVDENE